MQGNVNIPDSNITTNLSFRQLVLMNMQQLTNFPYIEKDFDALTDYELLCLVVKFLNDVIANQNEQNDSITRMYESFLALQTYVNDTKDTLENAFNNLDDYVRNYFDNLDVQEEINNKLDQMLEDGVLEQIIEQFLQSTAVWAFDTIADMKAATNLTNGSYARTLGFYSINDGGGSLYKIRTKTNEDTPDNMLVIQMNTLTLVADLILDDIINVKTLGIKADGTTDNASTIQSAINKLPNKTLFFPAGIYGIASHISTATNNDETVSLKLDDFAVIKALSTYDDENAMISLGAGTHDDYHLYDNYSNYGLDGGTIDCNSIASGISIENAVQTYVKNTKVNHCPLIGINVKSGSNNNSSDSFIDNCIIIGTNNTDAIGLNVLSNDSYYSNVRIFHCKYGVYIEGGGNHFENIHCLATTNDLDENYSGMVAFYVKGNYSYFEYPYNDQYATGFYLDGLRRTMVNNYYCYYWADDFAGQHTAIQCSARMTGRFNNVHCRFPAAGTNTILKVANTSLADGFIKELTIHNVANLNDSSDLGYNPTFNKDPILLDTTKLTNILEDLTFNYNQITACDSIINYNAIISGMTIPADTNTVLFKLPAGFYNPNAATNITAKLVNSATYQRIVCYISTSGSVIVNTPTAISGSQVQLIGSALNTQFSS